MMGGSESVDVVEDALLGGRVRLRQPRRGYRVAIDPVFLAAAVPEAPGSRVLDLGCGVGAAGLCLLARAPDARVTGLEIDTDLAELARANAALNGWDERFAVVTGDVVAGAALAAGAFDEVMCNPPHNPAGAPSPAPAKARATHESGATLADWVAGAVRHARPKGAVTFIHRADRLDELLALLRPAAGAAMVYPLWPRAGRPAGRVLVRARKGVSGPLSLSPGLVLHGEDGGFTPTAEAVLRQGRGLGFAPAAGAVGKAAARA